MADEPESPPEPKPVDAKPTDAVAADAHTFKYTAFDKWEYQQVIYKTERKQSWRDVADSFYQAALLLVTGVVNGELRDDIEGLAAVFLCRHYLELILKTIVLNSRWLVRVDQNTREEVQEVKRIHSLRELWRGVLKDAKPKLADGHWQNYDTAFVEACIVEFDVVDKKGFAFRYAGQGGEFCLFDFRGLLRSMEHIQQVLGGINTYLVEAYSQNAAYEEILESEFGGDMY